VYPPQGPFLKPFGHCIGQVKAVNVRIHWPHIEQEKNNPLKVFSNDKIKE
jgi:hypothetical protein